MIASTTRLNTPGRALSELEDVHALTDVTGFGLLGHTLELARGAGLTARLRWSQVPLIAGVRELAADGFVTGASARNWAGYGRDVRLDAAVGPLAQALLTDPQTSGGLLVACAPAALERVMAAFRREGFDDAAVVGELAAGTPCVEVMA
jgi:selenide,water dikinase